MSLIDRNGPQNRGAGVEFRRVSKTYGVDGRKPVDAPAAVHDLTLSVMPGEICVLVGPSGCGKTTTLKMVNRLVEPTSGHVLVDGLDVVAVDAVALRRRIGYVIQQIGLFPHETVAENVATVPRLLEWPRDRIRRRVDELLTLVGLDPDRHRDRYPSQLSGGERQRVGVARALAAEPPLMLMDEPFGAVDPISRERLQDEFLRIQRQIGMTVLFVTHDIDEAIKVGDRVAVMEHGGRLAQYSSPDELLMRPASDYVARFVGGDRALKRLTLIRVDALPLVAAETAPPGAPVFGEGTTARDALSALLASGASAGAVVGESGQLRGLLTRDAVAAVLRAEGATRPQDAYATSGAAADARASER
ncbi:MAG: ATP-binding cassette domain-containing protein [Chloroflexi bacterium]|nr:ATP-binding cassette domain-containing protein [Chloroflexota bacterium]